MFRPRTLLLTLFFLLVPFLVVVAAAPTPEVAPAAGLLNVETFVPGGTIAEPTAIANAGDARLFVVERAGRIRIVQPDGSVLPTPFLDISSAVYDANTEQGLLGLVFDPDYASNGYFYVNYTGEPSGDTRIARFSVSGDPNVANAGSELLILGVDQPHANHNAGDLLFGPDGYLYIPLGDGGSGNDPDNRAQDTQQLLGKMLRVDVSGQASGAPDCGGGSAAYTIPADNPFVDGSGGNCDEIWSYGLRNPWRASFDALTGDLYIGDVGQGAWEEIDRQAAASPGGENWGWSCFEGTHENPNTNEPTCQPASAYDMPVFEYSHSLGCAVTGGFVYRGSDYPRLYGLYLFADYCFGNVWTLDTAHGWSATLYDHLQASLSSVSTFGQDVNGELYAARRNNGTIYRIVMPAAATLSLPLVQK